MYHMKTVVIAMLLAMMYVVSGCNTVEGMGEDIQKGGEKIEDAAKK